MAVPDLSWLSALKLPTKTVLAIFFASIALLIARSFGLELDAWWPNTATVAIAVISGCFSITYVYQSVYELLEPARKRKAQEKAARVMEANAIGRIEYLSKEELHHVVECLRKQTQSFLGYYYSGVLGSLEQKDLLLRAQGRHNLDNFPFTWPDFVWKELLLRKDELITKHERLVAEAEQVKQARIKKF